MTKKTGHDAKDAKITGIVEDLEAPNGCLIIRTKNISSLMTVWGNTVTDAVLAATEFCGFCVHVTILPPLTLKNIHRMLSVLIRMSHT